MKQFDYLIVGSNLYRATFAYHARQAGQKCLIIDKRHHKEDNVYCENIERIHVVSHASF